MVESNSCSGFKMAETFHDYCTRSKKRERLLNLCILCRGVFVNIINSNSNNNNSNSNLIKV